MNPSFFARRKRGSSLAQRQRDTVASGETEDDEFAFVEESDAEGDEQLQYDEALNFIEMPSWWTHAKKKKNQKTETEGSPESVGRVRQQREKADFRSGPLFRFRADRLGHGGNNFHYRSSYGTPEGTDRSPPDVMWQSFVGTSRGAERGPDRSAAARRTAASAHPLLSILDNIGIGGGLAQGDEFESFLQEGQDRGHGLRQASPSSYGEMFRRPQQQPQASQMRFSSSQNAPNPNNMYGGDQSLFNMNGANPSIASVQPGVMNDPGPSSGNPFGGNMPPPSAPHYEYGNGGMSSRPSPPPPPPTLPAMRSGKSPRPSVPSGPPSASSSSSTSGVFPQSVGPFSPGVQSSGGNAPSATSMPEMPTGVNVNFLPRFKERSVAVKKSSSRGQTAFKNGAPPAPPLPKRPRGRM